MPDLKPILTLALAAWLALPGPAARAHGHAPENTCVARGQWLDPGTGKALDAGTVIARASGRQVVLLGETHVIADHHRWQLQTVSQIYAQNPNLVLGFEAFPRRVQPVLDQWVAGELSEAEFLKQSGWDSVWRYDAQLYLPLFHFARMNRVQMVALNVDHSLISRVSSDGWAAVPKDQRLGLGDPAEPDSTYVEMLGQSFGDHDNGPDDAKQEITVPSLTDPSFKRFVEVQQTWDRAMAEAIHATLAAGTDFRHPVFVGIMGRGHVDYGFGVPGQLRDLGVSDIGVLLPWDGLRQCDELAPREKGWPPVADAVFGMDGPEMSAHDDGPKLGIYIEEGKGGVTIKEVVAGSIAEKTGLQKDDTILQAAAQSVAQPGDLIAIVQAMAPGTWLPLKVQRGTATLELVARFPATTPPVQP